MQKSTSPNLGYLIKRLYSHLSKRRRTQLFGLLCLMLLGGLSEIITIGSVLPFLALIADPGKAYSFPALQNLFFLLGWTNTDSILLPATVLFVTVVSAAGAIRALLVFISNKVVFSIGYDMGVDIYSRTLFQPYSYHVVRNSSEIIAGLNKVQIIINGFLKPLMAGIISIITSIAILVALLLIDPVTAVIAAFGFSIIYIIITLITRNKLKNNSLIISRAQNVRIQAIQEGLGSIRDILIDNAQKIYIDKFKEVDAALRKAQIINSAIGATPRYLVESIGMVFIALFSYWLALADGGLVAALPVLGALAIGAQKLLPMMQQIYVGWASITGSKAIIYDVVKLLEQSIPEEYTKKIIPDQIEFNNKLILKDIGFSYRNSNEEILKNLNLEILKGSRVGFIGKTGSGKSTTIDLIMGLLEPTYGTVFIDGKPLTNNNRRNWQSKIAHVPQTIYLADASIAENIAFGVDGNYIDYRRVKKAAEQASISQYIESLPDKYKTAVGERGVRLSGGQRQRIGIARSLYKQAEILIFDEATSALDNDTEFAIMDTVKNLQKDLTIIMIAHRISTLRFCDRIFKISNGSASVVNEI